MIRLSNAAVTLAAASTLGKNKPSDPVELPGVYRIPNFGVCNDHATAARGRTRSLGAWGGAVGVILTFTCACDQ